MRLEPPVTSAGKADGRAGMKHEDEAPMGGHLVSLVPECEERHCQAAARRRLPLGSGARRTGGLVPPSFTVPPLSPVAAPLSATGPAGRPHARV